MRPGSRGVGGGAPGTSAGAPPGTGMNRPGSGMSRPPGTARLRTGIAPSGPGTQAAQGISIQTNVNVSDRPVTGQGMMGMKAQGGPGRLVEDSAYYIGLLRKKLSDISSEMNRLRSDMESNSKESSQYTQLEKKYEALIKNKETLEGQLADYNLALDKTRTSTDPEDVMHLAQHLAEKNRQTGLELDQIFMLTKQKENELNDIEDQIESQYRAAQSKIDSLDSSKRKAYEEFLIKQKEYQEKNIQLESKANELSARIRQLESDDKSNSLRKEFANLENQLQQVKRELENTREELDIANLDPKEAHSKFVARVNDFKQSTKSLEEKIVRLKEEISATKKNLEELSTNAEEDSSEAAKYDLLVKRDQEMTAFMDKFDETRSGVLEDQRKAQETIVALLEHISKGMEDSSNLPSQEAFGEMEAAKTFKEKNLMTAQKTMETLSNEKKKREQELEMLKQSEPKLRNEVDSLKLEIGRMKKEMKDFQDLEGLRRAFESTQSILQEQRQAYLKRRDAVRQQVQMQSAEHESLKKQLSSNEVARDLEETEKRMRHYERTIFELNEFVESKKLETDYDVLKGQCLKISENLNNITVKQYTALSKPSNAQAKW